MSIFEYDKEEEERKLREAEYEVGYNSGRRDGYSSGRQDGLNLGIAEGKREIIRLMHNAGEPVEKIAQYTGCEVEELKKLLN